MTFYWFLAQPGSLLQGYPKLFPELNHRLAIGNISIEESLARAKTWISRCMRVHVSCQRPPAPPLPKRVIEIDEDKIRLKETGGLCGSYIALSHCWGNSRPPCLTTTATIEANAREILWESLPNTFRDTIVVCKKLEIRYLWIDSICIIQDDEADWKEESAKMAAIYFNSWLTICATTARDDDVGLWSHVLKNMLEKVVVQKQFQDFEVYLRLKNESTAVHLGGESNIFVWPKTMALNPLISRGWTFQERLISPCLLHFGHGELLWQCLELEACECCFDAEKDSILRRFPRWSERRQFLQMLSGKSNFSVAETWRSMVETYSGLNLIIQNDMLPALSGLAKMRL